MKISKDFETVQQILSFQRREKILIHGDLNTRKNNTDDIIEFNKFDDGVNLILETSNSKRNYQDKIPCNQTGNELLELCKSHGLKIVNSRDRRLVTENDIFKNIPLFKIGDYHGYPTIVRCTFLLT